MEQRLNNTRKCLLDEFNGISLKIDETPKAFDWLRFGRLFVGKLYNKRKVRNRESEKHNIRKEILTAAGLLPKKLMSLSSPKRNTSGSAD